MDEQRILDEMERNLAADDPRLAARLGTFSQQRLPGRLRHARTIGGVLALVLIAAVTVMMFVISPFTNHAWHSQGKPRTVSSSQGTGSSGKTGSSAKTGTGGK